MYINPPDRAVVLSINGMTQIHALGRTRKGQPEKPRQPSSTAYDYKRLGTTTLFVTPDTLNGRSSDAISSATGNKSINAKVKFPSFRCFGGRPAPRSVLASLFGHPRFFGGGDMMGAFARTCSGMRSACCLSR